MADYYLLDGDSDGNSYRVAYQIPIPNTNNRVGINYRTALLQSLGGTQTSVAPTISQADQTTLNSGSAYELSGRVFTNPGETSTQLRDRIDASFAALRTATQTILQNRLAYWGFNRTVP